MTLAEYFAMGGKAIYIWPSYGISLLVLVGIVIAAWRSEKKIRRDIARQLRREERGIK